MKPLLGMALRLVFTIANVSGGYFCNVRRSQVGYHLNKFQNDEGIKPE